MSKCAHCGVYVLDDTEYCPLCKSVLEKPEEEDKKRLKERTNLYPDIYTGLRKYSLIKRILLFIAIVGSAAALYFDLQVTGGPHWGIIVTYGLFYALITICIVTDPNIGVFGKMITVLLLGLIYTIVIDLCFGFDRWSVNFVFPGFVFLVDIVLIIMMIVDNRDFQSYMVFEILMMLLGLVPIILILLKVVTFPTVSIIAFAASCVLFLGTLIIGGRAARAELSRRFHL